MPINDLSRIFIFWNKGGGDGSRAYVGSPHAIAVSNGTAALDVALKLLNVGPGDEVLVPAFTYIATANSVLFNHAKPVFVDVDDTLCIDPRKIEAAITPKTKVVVVVDQGGNPCDYDPLLAVTNRHGIPVVVDGAQSLGSIYKGRKCCTHGKVNTTSFHAAKILTTVEGGMLFVEEPALAERARSLRNQGETGKKYVHDYLGFNYRMTDLSAAFGVRQVGRFEDTLLRRRRLVDLYREALAGAVEFPREIPGTRSCYFLFIILVDCRDALADFLHSHGIDTRITYPMPINKQPVYSDYRNEEYPCSERACKRALSLPLYSTLEEGQVLLVAEKVREFLGGS